MYTYMCVYLYPYAFTFTGYAILEEFRERGFSDLYQENYLSILLFEYFNIHSII